MNGHQKDMCYDEVHNSLQSSEYVWRGSVDEGGDSQIDGTLFLTTIWVWKFWTKTRDMF